MNKNMPLSLSQPRKYFHRRAHTLNDQEILHKPPQQYLQYSQYPTHDFHKKINNINQNLEQRQDILFNGGSTQLKRRYGHNRIKTHIRTDEGYQNKQFQNFSKAYKKTQVQVEKPIKRQTGLQNQICYIKLNSKHLYNPESNKKTIKNNLCKDQPRQISSNLKEEIKNQYQIQGIAGKGTFGIVYYGRNRLTGEKIAIKKVLQDKRYKNRQLQILKQVKHINLLRMKQHYFAHEKNQQYLNVIMEYFAVNLYQVIKKTQLSPLVMKVYIYQMLRGINHLAANGIAHRDIKPHNILIDQQTLRLVICDFGSAKKLVKGEPNISYICSRCYRAPELMFGATQYTPQIDMWSLGCVIVQMINGEALFLGNSQLDQLLEIIKVLGTPHQSDIKEMNPQYDLKDYNKMPKIKPVSLHKVLKSNDTLLIDLVKRILEYSPQKRFSAAAALNHLYFKDLKSQQTLLLLSTQQSVPLQNLKSLLGITQKQNITMKYAKGSLKQSCPQQIQSDSSTNQNISFSYKIRPEKIKEVYCPINYQGQLLNQALIKKQPIKLEPYIFTKQKAIKRTLDVIK